MLEAVILDQVEKQSAVLLPTVNRVDRLARLPLGADIVGSIGYFISEYTNILTATSADPLPGNSGRVFPAYMPINGIYMFGGDAITNGLLSASFNPVTETFLAEDSIRSLKNYYEDASGVIWAVSDKPGYQGLWKRTGAGTWTLALADSNLGNLIGRWLSGVLYYKSSASNWYILSAGVATVSTNPGISTYSTWISEANDYDKTMLPGYFFKSNYNATSSKQSPKFRDDSAVYDGQFDYNYVWNWPARTRKILKSPDTYSFFENTVSNAFGAFTTGFIPVTSTDYVLQVGWRAMPFDGVNRGDFAQISLAILNFSTGQSQYLGDFKIPHLDQYGVPRKTGNVVQLIPRMARLNGNILRLYYLGLLGDMARYGALREDYSINLKV